VIRSAADILADSDNFPPRLGESGTFCEKVIELARGGKATPIDCGGFRDRFVLIGASHVDSQDSHTTPLGVMPGVDVLANGVLGARHILADHALPPSSALLLGLACFLVLAPLIVWKSRIFAIPLIIVLLLVLVLVAGMLGIDAATAYEAFVVAVTLLFTFWALEEFAMAVLEWRHGKSLKTSALDQNAADIASTQGIPK
jgi:CHASE2 domain-containing sensor protein